MAVSWIVILGVYSINTFDLFGDEWEEKLWARKSDDTIGNDE